MEADSGAGNGERRGGGGVGVDAERVQGVVQGQTTPDGELELTLAEVASAAAGPGSRLDHRYRCCHSSTEPGMNAGRCLPYASLEILGQSK